MSYHFRLYGQGSCEQWIFVAVACLYYIFIKIRKISWYDLVPLRYKSISFKRPTWNSQIRARVLVIKSFSNNGTVERDVTQISNMFIESRAELRIQVDSDDIRPWLAEICQKQ